MRSILLALALGLSATSCAEDAKVETVQVATMTAVSVDVKEGVLTLIDESSIKKTDKPDVYSSRVGVYFKVPQKDAKHEVQMVLLNIIADCGEETTAITNEMFLDPSGKVVINNDKSVNPVFETPASGSYMWVLSAATCVMASDKFANQPGSMGT